ncbi:hypothetical protein O9929_00340 [Vibrio lentus]|nr:hypothetical protein [Vibrio lentus]
MDHRNMVKTPLLIYRKFVDETSYCFNGRLGLLVENCDTKKKIFEETSVTS